MTDIFQLGGMLANIIVQNSGDIIRNKMIDNVNAAINVAKMKKQVFSADSVSAMLMWVSSDKDIVNNSKVSINSKGKVELDIRRFKTSPQRFVITFSRNELDYKYISTSGQELIIGKRFMISRSKFKKNFAFFFDKIDTGGHAECDSDAHNACDVIDDDENAKINLNYMRHESSFAPHQIWNKI